jgi:uncharacterized phage infection (PIP) family protein YhgE
MNEDLTKRIPKSFDGKLDAMFQLIQSVRAELTDLRNTVETRLYDTRPIWEKLTQDIGLLQAGQQKLEAGQQKLEAGQQKLEAGQQQLGARQQQLEAGQQQLEAGQQRLEAGQQRLEANQQGFDVEQKSLKANQELIRTDIREVRTHLRDLDRRFTIFNDTLVGIQADYRDIYDRVREIERQRM